MAVKVTHVSVEETVPASFFRTLPNLSNKVQILFCNPTYMTWGETITINNTNNATRNAYVSNHFLPVELGLRTGIDVKPFGVETFG